MSNFLDVQLESGIVSTKDVSAITVTDVKYSVLYMRAGVYGGERRNFVVCALD